MNEQQLLKRAIELKLKHPEQSALIDEVYEEQLRTAPERLKADQAAQKIRVNIEPMSVNDAWKGRRFKTDKYKQYTTDLLWLLPKIKLPEPPYQIRFVFGFSSTLSDWDNPVKPTQDVLCKKYGFDDRQIRKAVVETEIVPKGQEFFVFEIKTLIE